MKKIKVAAALCATAILCASFAACSKNNPGGEKTSFNFDHASVITATTTKANTTKNTQTTKPIKTTKPHTTKPITTAANTTKPLTTAEPNKPTSAKPIPGTTVPTTLATTTQLPTTSPTTTQPTTLATTEPTTAVTVEPSTTITIVEGEDVEFEKEALRLVNETRKKEGLEPLAYSAELAKATDIRAAELSEKFSHTRPDGSEWNTVSEQAMAENIAMGQSSPQIAVNSWFKSEGHKKNMLNPDYKTSAIGCYYDSQSKAYYWVQLFGY